MNTSMTYHTCFRKALLTVCIITAGFAHAQKAYTRADTLRGGLRQERTSYDVHYYELDIRADLDSKSISGHNYMYFKVLEPMKTLQVDLFENMVLDSILFKDRLLDFRREFNAVFIQFRDTLPKGEYTSLKMYYHGKPTVARRPPWDGGFIWTTDKQGRPWAAVACEHFGASSWWPNKDHLSDEPDSMKVFVEVPKGLFAKSNGRLMGQDELENGWQRFGWRVTYPINNYNVTLNIGHYTEIRDEYGAEDGDVLDIAYHVLDYNRELAEAQFVQTKPMLSCFENWFGKYPFWNDGFSVVETPYLGMEHQGAIAYGNKFKNGYLGMDRTGTGIGQKFDYILIHESAHEYWGNHVGCQDHADLWIHESFTTYAEALYVECLFGKEEGARYINGMKRNVENKTPMVASYGVNANPPGDIYDKGALMLHTMRHVLDDDHRWKNLLRSIQETYGMTTINTGILTEYMVAEGDSRFMMIFEQYLRHAKIPVFEYQWKKSGKEWELRYRWEADVTGFDMPFELVVGKEVIRVGPTANEWRSIKLNTNKEVAFATGKFYVDTREIGGSNPSSK